MPRPRRHALDAGLGGALGEVVPRDPPQIMGLVADSQFLPGSGEEQEADVVVEMRGFVTAGWDGVDIEVEWELAVRSREQVKVGQAGFLLGFALRHLERVGIAVGVAAELEPALQLAVMGEEHRAAVGRDDPRGAGDVAGEAGALEAVSVGLDEVANLGDARVVLRPAVAMDLQEVEQRAAVHRQHRE